jgi:hypothetical protein
MADRNFIVWDGEGPKDTSYSLLGNSEGEELCYPTLTSLDCLNFIIESGRNHPYAIHVGFGFNYDVSNILRDLPWRHLAQLRKTTRTRWQGFAIQHVPRKWFRVQRDGVAVTIFDVISYFASSLVGALEKWEIGPFAPTNAIAISIANQPVFASVPSVDALSLMPESEIVRIFKGLRSEFLWKDIESIRRYMRLELKYTKILMETLRRTFVDAGYLPTSWHGPAGLSRIAMRKHRVFDAMAESPYDVKLAARYAFFGGRFEQFFSGHAGRRLYVADLNSAYPYFCAQLPNLARGTWRRGRAYEYNKFAVYHIRYNAKPDRYRCYPLPKRDNHNNVLFPHRVEGWYWGPEAELVAENPDAEFLESWVFDESDPADRPFAWIVEYFRRRQVLKRLGNPAEFTFKLIINAVYGCLAQRTGWDQKHNSAPRSHQLEWAGYITSACRAAVYRVARTLGDDLVSIDTDGITSLRPFDLVNSKELGGWELSEYQDGLFWQSGIYALWKGIPFKWQAKMRGIERGTDLVDTLFECYREGKALKLNRNVFINYGLALQGQREALNTWRTEQVEFKFGGTGKRIHQLAPQKSPPKSGRTCAAACSGDHHRLALPPVAPFGDCMSSPHALPWLGDWQKLNANKQVMDDQTIYGENEWTELIGSPI